MPFNGNAISSCLGFCRKYPICCLCFINKTNRYQKINISWSTQAMFDVRIFKILYYILYYIFRSSINLKMASPALSRASSMRLSPSASRTSSMKSSKLTGTKKSKKEKKVSEIPYVTASVSLIIKQGHQMIAPLKFL